MWCQQLSLVVLAYVTASASSTACTISNVFGDHMVLQRAPAKAMVFGFAAPGTTVKTTNFGGADAVTDNLGVWRMTLAPQPASTSNAGVTIAFACSSGESLALNDVLFGEVHICGGQSNMQFTLGCIGQQLGYDAKAGGPTGFVQLCSGTWLVCVLRFQFSSVALPVCA
jgi:sialate O-acetylesterase